jgi:hypothetical protein
LKGERREIEEKGAGNAQAVYCEVLHMVLYPNMHENGLEKKKKVLPYKQLLLDSPVNSYGMVKNIYMFDFNYESVSSFCSS